MNVASADQTVAEALAMLDSSGEDFLLLQDARKSGILISEARYQSLSAERSARLAQFNHFRDELSAKVQSRGLTEEKLDAMLREIDAETPR